MARHEHIPNRRTLNEISHAWSHCEADRSAEEVGLGNSEYAHPLPCWLMQLPAQRKVFMQFQLKMKQATEFHA